MYNIPEMTWVPITSTLKGLFKFENKYLKNILTNLVSYKT